MMPSHRRPSRRTASRWGILCLASIAAFAVLAVAAFAGGVLPGDLELREGLVEGGSAALYELALVANWAGSWQGLAPGFALLLLVSRIARRHWWLFGAVLIAAPIAEATAKALVDRPRPNSDFPGFPSGHVTAFTAFAVVVIYLAGRERLSRAWQTGLFALLVAVIALVSLARLYLHAHWPSDLLGGWLLGIACGAAGAWCHGALVPADPPPVDVGAPAPERAR